MSFSSWYARMEKSSPLTINALSGLSIGMNGKAFEFGCLFLVSGIQIFNLLEVFFFFLGVAKNKVAWQDFPETRLLFAVIVFLGRIIDPANPVLLTQGIRLRNG